MGKVRKPPPTPMMEAQNPTSAPLRTRKSAEMRRPPGTRPSSNRIIGGTLTAWRRLGRPPISTPSDFPLCGASTLTFLRARRKSESA